MEIRKGGLRLKQVGRIPRDLLTKNLSINGYAPVKHTPSLWSHHTSDLMFSLVVNNVGIKYTGKEDKDHLIKSLRKDYEITEDWIGEKYLGLTLKWDYVKRNVRISMPGYIKLDLLKLQHESTKPPQYALHHWNQPMYGSNTQYAYTNNAELLDAQSTLYMQKVCGKLPILLHSRRPPHVGGPGHHFRSTGPHHHNPHGSHLLVIRLRATNPNTTLHYYASYMILHIARNAPYLCEERAHSQ